MSIDFFKENIPEGTTFESRMELKEAGLHKYPVHGISDDKDSGCAFSVVVAHHGINFAYHPFNFFGVTFYVFLKMIYMLANWAISQYRLSHKRRGKDKACA